MSLVDVIRHARPSSPVLAFALALALGFCPPGVGAQQQLLEQDLARTDQAITDTQAELERALAGYDQEAVARASRRIRELKRRRVDIAAKIAAELKRDDIAETTLLVRRRESMRGRLEELEREEAAAAAAFKARPGSGPAVRLRDLNLEIIRLKEDLKRADELARTSGGAASPDRP